MKNCIFLVVIWDYQYSLLTWVTDSFVIYNQNGHFLTFKWQFMVGIKQNI